MTAVVVQEAFEMPDPNPDTKAARKSAVGSALHSCGGCDSRWGGANTAHCASCHHTFGGVSGFDRHRKDGTCLDPVAMGMHLDAGRPYASWSFPWSENMPDTEPSE